MAEDDVLDAGETTEEANETETPDFAERLKEAVVYDVTDIGPLRKRLSIRVPRETIDEQQSEQLDELSREALVPGFRRGRAPRTLVVKRFGRDVDEQLKSEVLSRGYMAAVEKGDLKVIGDPELVLTGDDGKESLLSVEEAFDKLTLPAEGDMSFVCEVEIRPEFDLPELEGFELKKPVVNISDEDVQKQIDRLRGMQGTFEPVEGKIKEDDLVIADMVLSVDDAEVKREENATFAARPQQIDGIAVEDLGKALVGKKADDKVTVEADVPDDHANKEWAGKKASFALTIADVKRLALPAIDEAFLKNVGFESEDELRDWVREDMTARLGDAIRDGLRRQVREYLLEKTEVELPEGLSSRQAGRAADMRAMELRRQGVPDAEIDKHADEIRVQARAEAVNDLKLFFIMEKLAEALDVHVGEDEINGQIALMAQRYNQRFDRMRDQLSRGDGLTSLYMQLRDERIIDQLIMKAKVVEAEGPKSKGGEKSSDKPAKKKTSKKSGKSASDEDK